MVQAKPQPPLAILSSQSGTSLSSIVVANLKVIESADQPNPEAGPENGAKFKIIHQFIIAAKIFYMTYAA